MQARLDNGNISFGGLASGLKTDEIVPALVDKSRGPMRKIEQHQEILDAHQELLETVQRTCVELGFAAHEIDSVNKFLVQRAQSTNDEVCSAVAGNGAVAGIYRVWVDTLATAQRSMSASIADAEAPIGPGKLSWSFEGAREEVEVLETDTLRTIASAINRKSAGAAAHVVFDGREYRLQLDGTQTGAKGALEVEEEGLPLALTDAEAIKQVAADASFRIDNGHLLTRPENIVHDAIEGVTLALEQADAGATVRVSADADAMVQAVATFVGAYNLTLDAINLASQAPGTPSKLDRGRLVGDTALRHMHQALQQAVTTPVQGIKGPWTSVSQVGVFSGKDGRIRIDEAKLRDSLRRQPAEVARLFGRDRRIGTQGVGVATQKVVDHYTMPMTGVLPGRLQSITRQRGTNDQQLTHMQAQLEKYEGHLREQFSTLERNMTKMNGQKDFLEQQLKSVSHNR